MNPPSCFGRDYNNENPVCQQCPFQQPCRQTIINAEVQKTMSYQVYAVPPPPGAVQQPQFFTPTAVPPPTYVPTAPVAPQQVQWRPPPPPPPPTWAAPQQVPVSRVPVGQPQQQQVAGFQPPQGLPYSPLGYYGYIPDGMWQAVSSVPPPWRPQQPGETFGVRVAKNLALVLAEAVFQQFIFAVRQAYLPPRPAPAYEAVVEMAPAR